MMMLVMFFLFGFIQHVSSIKCYTCNEPGFFCSLPLNLDGGAEHNENDVASFDYDSDHFCQSDHFIDSKTGIEKIILRGIRFCEELDITNHRTYCCNTDNCNKWLPIMTRETVIYSNEQRFLPSIVLIILSVIFQYFY